MIRKIFLKFFQNEVYKFNRKWLYYFKGARAPFLIEINSIIKLWKKFVHNLIIE